MTKKRIDELKTEFTKSIDMIVSKLSKNPDYSSDKLKQYAEVQKNAFNSYVYELWYKFYKKVGDKKKILNLTKIKKENDLRYKKSFNELKSKMAEKDKTIDIFTDGQYLYKNCKGKTITVNVIGTGLGKDEHGKTDNTKPDYSDMWQVESGGETFWVSPSSLKPKEKK